MAEARRFLPRFLADGGRLPTRPRAEAARTLHDLLAPGLPPATETELRAWMAEPEAPDPGP